MRPDVVALPRRTVERVAALAADLLAVGGWGMSEGELTPDVRAMLRGLADDLMTVKLAADAALSETT